MSTIRRSNIHLLFNEEAKKYMIIAAELNDSDAIHALAGLPSKEGFDDFLTIDEWIYFSGNPEHSFKGFVAVGMGDWVK